MQHPVIEEFYRVGTTAEKNRKCFVRIRVPSLGKQQIPIEWDVNVQSHSTHRDQQAMVEPTGSSAQLNGKSERKHGQPMFVVRLVQGMYTYVLLVADETGEWGVKSGCTSGDKTECSILQHASVEDTLVLPAPHLIHLVDQTFPDIDRKIDTVNDLEASVRLAETQMSDTSQYTCSAELGDKVTDWINPEGAPGKSFATKEACEEHAEELKKNSEVATASEVFKCARRSERPTVFRFKAGEDTYSTESSCRGAAGEALKVRDAQLQADKNNSADATYPEFTAEEKQQYGMEPIVYIVQRGAKQIRDDIGTVQSDIVGWNDSWSNAKKMQELKEGGKTLTPMEQQVYFNKPLLLDGVHVEYENDDTIVDGVRTPFAGALWLVKDENAPAQNTFAFTDATWCVDQPRTKETLHYGQIPYELMVGMGEEYPGTCGREHFDYGMGVCRIAQNGKFSLMGYDDGVSMPLTCAAGSEDEMHTMCKNRLDTFDTRSAALRHCETRGCSGILHQTDAMKSGSLLNKEWAAVTGVMDQDHPFGLKARPGIDSIVVSGIPREQVDQYVPIPLCGFCDRDGIPAAALPSKETCCKCGGGERRRFFSVPTRLMTNPLIPYLAPRSVHPINGGNGYKVGDVLTLRSDGVPAARGGKVRVTKVHRYKGVQIPLGSAGDCDAACNVDAASVAIKSIGDNQCLCAKPGDPRLPGHITEVEIVSRGQDYESGAAKYVATGGSGTGASFHVNTVDLYGGMLGTESPTMFQSMKNIIAAGLGAAALGAGIAAVFLYRSKGAKIGFSVGGAGAVALLGAVVVLVMGNPKPTSVHKRPPPEQRVRAKSSEVCGEGEHLVEGQCMTKEDAKAALMLRHAGFLQPSR